MNKAKNLRLACICFENAVSSTGELSYEERTGGNKLGRLKPGDHVRYQWHF